MKYFDKFKSFFKLLECGWILLIYSSIILFGIHFTKNKKRFVNHYMRRGAVKILKKIQVKYAVNFAQELNFKHYAPPYVFMSNHLSLIDLPLIYATLFGTIRPLPKKSLFQIPLFGQALQAAGLIPIDKDHPNQMRELYSIFKKNHSDDIGWWIFPEGSRSVSGQLQPFKLGGFRLARELGAKIIPVGITGTHQVLAPRSFRLNLKQTIGINIGVPIDTKHFTDIRAQKELVAQVREAIRNLSTTPTELS